MSSGWAPRHKTRNGPERRAPRGGSRRMGSAVRAPHFPRRLAARVEILELLLVLERVHGGKEPVVTIRHQLLGRDQPLERLLHELLAVAQVVENLTPEHKVAAVDPEIGL